MNSSLDLKYGAFTTDLCAYIPQEHIDEVAPNVKELFDRACEVKATENLPSRQLRWFKAPSVHLLCENTWNHKFLEQSIPLINRDLKNPLKTLANIYNIHFRDNDKTPSGTVFDLMLTEDLWSATASKLQRELSNEIDFKNRLVILLSSLASFLFLGSAYWLSNPVLALLGCLSLAVLYFYRNEL